jgi:hypothetical protein
MPSVPLLATLGRARSSGFYSEIVTRKSIALCISFFYDTLRVSDSHVAGEIFAARFSFIAQTLAKADNYVRGTKRMCN